MATKKQADTAKLEKAFNKSSEVKTHDDLKLIIERAKKAQKNNIFELIYLIIQQKKVTNQLDLPLEYNNKRLISF